LFPYFSQVSFYASINLFRIDFQSQQPAELQNQCTGQKQLQISKRF
jgi:hypothetical protein